MRIALLVVPAVLALSACVSENGKEVDQTKVAAFQKGVTTKQQVIDALGPPTSSGFQAETGQNWLAWSHAKTTISGASFVPIIGPMLGGTSGQVQSCLFYFDAANLYASGSCQASQMNGGAHLGG